MTEPLKVNEDEVEAYDPENTAVPEFKPPWKQRANKKDVENLFKGVEIPVV